MDRNYSKKHVEHIAKITNQSEEMVLFELENAMLGLLKENTKKLIEEELKSEDILDTWVPTYYGFVHRQPRGLVFHNVSGNAFIVIPVSIAMGLISKNVNLVKVSKDEPYFACVFYKSLMEIDESIKDRLSIVYFDSSSSEIYDYIVSNSDCVVHWGGKTSRDYMASLCAKHSVHFIEHGPKVSFEVIDKEPSIDDIKGIALDMSLWEQKACLSPRIVFLNSEVNKEKFLYFFRNCLEEIIQVLPKGYYDYFSSIKTLQDRQHLFLNNIDNPDFKLICSKNSDFTIVYSNSLPKEREIDMCLGRFIYVCPYYNKKEVIDYINNNLKGYLQTMGYCGDDFEFIEQVTLCGVSIVTRPGEMSLHKNGTSHDGIYNLNELTYVVSYQRD
ncbi:acyl-CoA reductase [Caloramator sp. mosi_1]|uniref:acyl-CoA reductase n=1 Tax=Caloramator sp. mosi_1 TaxID=3023090 RepID=UPI00235FCBBC|nr:acyl-CoA reductase [Caloramator sp. mosi_1]WDC85489.1 acyl-CoA reductase [Caloramator sp. mosi_1]